MKLPPVIPVLLLLLNNSASGDIEVLDDLGNKVRIAAPAENIVSLAPHLTELLFSLGVGHRIKGTSRYSDYPAAARTIPVVGDAFSTSVESIIAQQPDIIFAWSTGGANRALERLKTLGYPIYLNEAATLDGIGNTLMAMAELVGRKEIGLLLRDSLTHKLNELRTRYKDEPVEQVFFQISDQNLYTVNKYHLIGQALQVCNARNIFADETIPVPLVSKESVISRDPKIIIISKPKEGLISPWVKRWGAFEGYAERLRWIDPGFISHPSLRMIEGIEQLCRLIHRER